MALVYDPVDSVAYCSVPKVASSTWCWHFIQLANISQEEISKRHQVLQTFAPHLWPPPTDPEELVKAWSQTTSIVIVRHPLARLQLLQYIFNEGLPSSTFLDWCLAIIRSSLNLLNMEHGLQKSDSLLKSTENTPIQETRFIHLLKSL